MFGDSWVPPDALFDPADGVGPPADAFDVQFRVPVSLAVYVDELAREGRRHELAEFTDLYREIVDATVKHGQRRSGTLGTASRIAARLAITPVIEFEVPGVAGLHPHVHLYVGSRAVDIPDGETVHEVPEAELAEGMWSWVTYQRLLHNLTSERLGLRWGPPRRGAMDEVLDPPYAERMAGWTHPVCPGRWGPRRLLLADAEELELAERSQREAELFPESWRPSPAIPEWEPGQPTRLPDWGFEIPPPTAEELEEERQRMIRQNPHLDPSVFDTLAAPGG